MYIEYLNYQNVGAIRHLSISLSFHENGNPKPVIFVGENGSGKSILLSNIVDAFYELASVVFNNVAITEGERTKFYKVISPLQITTNEPYMVAYIRFKDNEDKIDYIFKSGNKDWNEYNSEHFPNAHLNLKLKWENTLSNHKIAVILENQNPVYEASKKVESIFKKAIHCYFAPNRYEKPSWLGDQYHSILAHEKITLDDSFIGVLKTPICVVNVAADNLTWLLDVTTDSRADLICETDDKAVTRYNFRNSFKQNDLIYLMRARENIELILSDILGKKVYFQLANRMTKGLGRFRIVDDESGNVAVPSFDSLSTGQMALFNLFVTIIRYADYNDANKSINLNDISGIVVIDEIELHLHSSLQRDVLPKLIQRFPKIQFIITSHSPLFILGMENVFNSDGYELFQMPEGNKINAEMFSEFQKAYDYLTQTRKYQSELASIIKEKSSKTLIVTEGKSDTIHLKAAFNNLKEQTKYSNILADMDFEFFEDDKDMGDQALLALCKQTAELKRDNIVIFIADADNEDICKKLGETTPESKGSYGFKFHKNQVYSFIIPCPDSRKATPLISIEHLYSDDIIKTEISCDDGISRRLYLGNEFDQRGMGDNFHCIKKSINKCGKDKISIIDNDVYSLVKNSNNIALSKICFAEAIAKGKPPFDNIDFKEFVPIFETIQNIIEYANKAK